VGVSISTRFAKSIGAALVAVLVLITTGVAGAQTPIHDIQGPGATSPIVGATVTTRGIVTNVKSDGFFIQEPDATVDADPATSEGIFVFTSIAPPGIATLSAMLEVTGTVTEFVPSGDPQQPSVTQITPPSSITTISPPGLPLPVAVLLTPTFPDPAGPFDQLERLEGMRVRVTSLTVTGANAGGFDEVNATGTLAGVFHGVVTGVTRPFREAGIEAPDLPPTGTIPPIPRWDANPERIRIEGSDLFNFLIPVKSGDVVGPFTGTLDYSSRSYALALDAESSPGHTPGTLTTTVTAPTGNVVTVASINLRRLFDTTDDAGADVVLTSPAYARRLTKASIAIRTHLHNPDIIGVQEAENLGVLTALAAQIVTDGGSTYTPYLVEGNDAAGLDVGFLVKSDLVGVALPRVSVTSVTQVLDGTLLVNPDSSTETLNDRPPLVLEAVVNRTSTASFPIVVVVTDQAGLAGIDDATPGSNGWPTAGDRVRQKRLEQAKDVANYIQSRQTNDPAEHLVVVGSFNAIDANDGYTDVMNTVAGTPVPDNQTVVPGDGVDLVNPDLVNLSSTAAAAERYSEVFLGNARNLDHVLVNAPMIASTSARRIAHPRIGADYSELAMNGNVDALRFSDRDPVLAYFTVDSFALADLAVTKVDSPDPVNAGQNLTYTITVTNNGPDLADAASWNDTLPPGTTFVSMNSPGGWSCTLPAVGAAGAIDCSTASMSVGSAVFTLVVAVSPVVAHGTVISNTATVTAATGDANTGDNSATSTTTVSTSANLSTLVADSPDPVAAGQNITYTITVANSGPSVASAVTVTNPVAGNATFVSASVLSGSGWSIVAPAVGATGNVVFSKASVGATENALFEVVVKIAESTPGGTVHMNTATAASATLDPTPVGNSVSATTTVDGKPTISDINNELIDEDTATAPLPFTIGDVETAPASLTVTASSSNQTLVPDANIVVGGAGANRTITVTPAANQNGGPAIITVTVRDGAQLTTSDTFTLTVNPVNDDPTIGTITNQSVNANTTVGPLPFTVDDIDNDVSGLTVSGSSSNQTLVANAGITFGGSAGNRTITVTPLADQDGQTTITVTVSDGTATASTSFILTVAPGEPTPTVLNYYLAEGATGSFFDEDLTIANPNDAPAPVTITFFREGMTNITETRTVPARSGITLRVDTLEGLEATSASVQVTSEDGLPLAVERTQFWGEGSYGGHTENALTAPATRWFFAEGSQGYFDTFVLIANPQDEAVDVTLSFLREGDTTVTTTVQVGPMSRKTIHAASLPDLVNRSFGIIVDAPQPIMAERAMYFGSTPTRPWSGGGAAAGATTPSTDWYFAEGATGTFFDTFILLMNPDENNAANITLRYLLDSGETVEVPKVIPASGRLTVNIEAEDDARLYAASMSARITSDRPIVAERAVYWPTAEGAQPWGESHVTQGVTAAAPRWALAEGRTGGPLNFHTYVLLGNPGAQTAEVTVRFLPQTGTEVVKTYTVLPNSRFTIDATAEAPTIQNGSFITVISTAGDVPIVVERSLYWDGAGLTWSGGSSAVATRLP
jgi:uncharacterized repeat protein (TIGR01451 family)